MTTCADRNRCELRLEKLCEEELRNDPTILWLFDLGYSLSLDDVVRGHLRRFSLMSPRLLWALACDLAGELAHVVVPPGGERRGSTGLCAGRKPAQDATGSTSKMY
jgi:hypothetical protein